MTEFVCATTVGEVGQQHAFHDYEPVGVLSSSEIYEDIIQMTSECMCCDRHQIRRPGMTELLEGFNGEYCSSKLMGEDHACDCDCRQTARIACRHHHRSMEYLKKVVRENIDNILTVSSLNDGVNIPEDFVFEDCFDCEERYRIINFVEDFESTENGDIINQSIHFCVYFDDAVHMIQMSRSDYAMNIDDVSVEQRHNYDALGFSLIQGVRVGITPAEIKARWGL